MSNLKKEKQTNLSKAFKKINALGIKMSIEQYIEFTGILKDYGLSEWREGRESIKKTYNL